MILGIGIDTVEIHRVLKACERNGRFVEKTYTKKEREQFEGHQIGRAHV